MDSTLPLPVAALVRRARNAKSPRDRHDTAYRAWEVAVMLAAAERIAAAAAGAPPEFERPSIGDWVAVLRRDEGAQLRSRAVLDLHAFLRRAAFEETVTPQSVSASRLLESIPRYRNRFVGHGTVLQDHGFYADGASALVAGLEAAADEGLFGARSSRLIFVESVEIGPDGQERARAIDLTGETPRVLDEVAAAKLPHGARPSRVFAWDAAAVRLVGLHPFAAYDAERERVYLFNGVGRRAEYLDFGSGERLSGKALDERFPGLEADLLVELRAERPTGVVADEKPADSAHRFSDFRILGKLGEGGMGEVYLAVQESLDRVVALKVIRSVQADDPVARGRFQREIRALARCDHPNVVKILTSGSERGVLWYAMEHVEGADLAQVGRSLTSSSDLDTAVSSAMDAALEERRALFPDAPPVSKARPAPLGVRSGKTQQLAAVMRDAARGVAHLHERGILHRDLKPANLMLTPERRVVVMDLGLARLSDSSSSLTQDRMRVLGTLRYMAPEQLQRNLLHVDARADVYGLGATFYELFTSCPFLDGDTEARLIQQVLQEGPKPPRIANPALSKDLALILAKCVEPISHARYGTAADVADDLDAWLELRPVRARARAPLSRAWLWGRRNRPVAASVAACAVAMTATMVAVFGRATPQLAPPVATPEAPPAEVSADACPQVFRSSAPFLIAGRLTSLAADTPVRVSLGASIAAETADVSVRTASGDLVVINRGGSIHDTGGRGSIDEVYLECGPIDVEFSQRLRIGVAGWTVRCGRDGPAKARIELVRSSPSADHHEVRIRTNAGLVIASSSLLEVDVESGSAVSLKQDAASAATTRFRTSQANTANVVITKTVQRGRIEFRVPRAVSGEVSAPRNGKTKISNDINSNKLQSLLVGANWGSRSDLGVGAGGFAIVDDLAGDVEAGETPVADADHLPPTISAGPDEVGHVAGGTIARIVAIDRSRLSSDGIVKYVLESLKVTDYDDLSYCVTFISKDDEVVDVTVDRPLTLYRSDRSKVIEARCLSVAEHRDRWREVYSTRLHLAIDPPLLTVARSETLRCAGTTFFNGRLECTALSDVRDDPTQVVIEFENVDPKGRRAQDLEVQAVFGSGDARSKWFAVPTTEPGRRSRVTLALRGVLVGAGDVWFKLRPQAL